MSRWLNTERTYGWLSIALHWLSALVIIGLFGVGVWMVDFDYYHPLYQTVPDLHKSIGITFVVVTLLRLGLRMAAPRPAPLGAPGAADTIAHLVHLAFYALLFAIMVSGYLISTADGRAIEVFGLFEVPATITSIPDQEDTAGDVHWYLALGLIILASLHALAALKHHFINGDATLRRMLGRTPEQPPKGNPQ